MKCPLIVQVEKNGWRFPQLCGGDIVTRGGAGVDEFKRCQGCGATWSDGKQPEVQP